MTSEFPDPPAADLSDRLRQAACLLLDFDGPICRLFARRPASRMAVVMRKLIEEHGVEPTEALAAAGEDPHQIVRVPLPGALPRDLESYLADEEEEAAESAEPTPGAAEFVRLMAERGRVLAITTNNAPRAVAAYLKKHDLDGVFDHRIFGRTPDDPRRMKPDPDCLLRATAALGAAPGDCLMIGDSPADVQAAVAAGVPFLGYARSQERVARLAQLPGGSTVVVGMARLVAAARDVDDLNE